MHGGSRCDEHKRVETGKFNDRRRGSRHERGYGSAWSKLREQIMVRDKGVCQPCWKRGVATPAYAVDHILSKGEWKWRFGVMTGVDDPVNLQAICRTCHAEKTAREGLAAQGRGGSKV